MRLRLRGLPRCMGGLLLTALLPAAPELTRYEATEPHMGTLFRIVLYAPSEKRADHAFRAAFQRIHELDETLSDYKPQSELNRLCRTPAGRATTVSTDLFTVLAASQRLASQSGGAFDITLGPVIRLWREARYSKRLPSAETLAAARERTGYKKLVLDAQHRTALLQGEGMQLDLGGIAKGYAADEALLLLRQRGLPRALVAASGDLAIGEAPPDQPGWRVAVEPLGETSRRVLTLTNAAVSTSGDTEQYVEIEGRRYSHIVNPRTGTGMSDAVGVTILAANGITADSLATAVRVLGRAQGLPFIDRYTQAAALLGQAEAGTVRLYPSRRWLKSP